MKKSIVGKKSLKDVILSFMKECKIIKIKNNKN